MYSPQQKRTVGHYDQKPISGQYQAKLNGFRKALHLKQTDAEKHFETYVASLIAEEAHTKVQSQRIFYITDDVAFIADFYFPNFKVAVEIDGSSHLKYKEQQRDEWRDGLLARYAGITTIRFSNKEVMTNSDEAYMRLIRFLAKQERATPSHRKYLRRVYSHLLIDG